MAGPAITPRQRAVLRLITRGYSTPQIAIRLRITIHTVTYHRRNLLKRLGARNKAQLVLRAHRLGIR